MDIDAHVFLSITATTMLSHSFDVACLFIEINK